MDESHRPITLITGCARSGTSLTAQVLQACGANLGDVNSLYEHKAVRDRLVKPYLSRIGADPLGQNPLPDYEDLVQTDDWRGAVEQRLKGADTYKGAKITLLWPVWADAFPDARWVLCWRDIGDIAASCKRTAFMQAYTEHEDWREWARAYHQRMQDLRESESADYIDVWPHEAVTEDVEAYRPVVEHCGLTWDSEAVQRVIRRNAWHA